MEKAKNKILSLRVDECIYDFVDTFSKKIKLSKSETLIFMLKRSIGIFKFENIDRSIEDSILNKVLEIISENKEVSVLDKKIITTVYRLLDLDIISCMKINEIISKELSLNLINSLIDEELTVDVFLDHIKKMDSLIPNFSPYYLIEVNQYFKHKILTKEKSEDTLFTLGINSNVMKFINNQK